MVINLNKDYPILFFPLRLETKYYNEEKILRIRFFPDQISIDNFDPRLSEKEFQAATEYCNIIKDINEDDTLDPSECENKKSEVWITLLEDYDCFRAAYIIKQVIKGSEDGSLIPYPRDEFIQIHQDFRADDEHKAADFKTLPNKFIIYGIYNNDELAPLIEEITPASSPKSLKVSPLSLIYKGFTAKSTPIIFTPDYENPPEDPYKELDPELEWLSNFNKALTVGMAAEFNLTNEQYESGFKYLLVFGVRDDLSSADTKELLEKLFQSHQYKGDLSFLKLNTPTNLTDGLPPEYSSAEPDPLAYYELEFGENEIDPESDGNIFEKLLGFNFIVKSVQNANITEQKDAKTIASLLYPAVLGNFIQMVRTASKPLEELLDPERIKIHFVNNVAPPGILFRINKVPYGLLPITISSRWNDSTIIPNTSHLKQLFSTLKQRWLDYSENIPTLMNPEEGVSLDQNLINILSMDPYSHSYYARGIRNLAHTYKLLYYKSGYSREYAEFVERHIYNVNKIWEKILFKKKDPLQMRNWSYDLILGEGIENLEYPLVGDLSYVSDIIENLDDNFKPTEEEHLLSLDAPLLQKFLIFSANYYATHGVEEDRIDFEAKLNLLSEMDPKTAEMWMLKIMDTTSYRLDAWLASLYNQKISQLRDQNQTGLYMGAYGWVLNLKPNIKNPTKEGGYVRAFDHAQASALAVMRDAYLSHWVEDEKKDMLKINIPSERTRNALETLQALENIPLSEYLGMKLERRLHDAELDFLIDEFRKFFPLQKDDLIELSDLSDETKERVIPRNITDGKKVQEEWKKLIKAFKEYGFPLDIRRIKQYMESKRPWDKFYYAIKSYPDSIKNIIPHINYLLDIVDGLSDLSLYEAIYQAVNLKFERSAAFLDGLGADGHLPSMESPHVSLSGPRITRRIILFMKPLSVIDQIPSLPEITDDPIDFNPRIISEPSINGLVNGYFGDVKFWLFREIAEDHIEVANENPISLDDLDLDPIDLLFIHETELSNRLLYYGRKALNLINVKTKNFIKPESANLDDRSYSDIRFMVNSLKEILASGRSFANYHLENPNLAEEGYNFNEIFEILTRYYFVLHKIFRINENLTIAKNNNLDPEGVIEKENGLLDASKFGFPSAIPVTREEETEKYIVKLNNKIETVLKAFESLHAFAFNDSREEITFLRGIIINDEMGETQKINEVSGKYLTTKEVNFIADNIEEDSLRLRELLNRLLEKIRERFKIILNNKVFLVLPKVTPSQNSRDVLDLLTTDDIINEVGHKWLQKCAYTRPKVKSIDKVIDYNHVFDSSKFSFFYNNQEFFRTAEEIIQDGNDNPLSIFAIKSKKLEFSISIIDAESDNLVGIVLDDHTIKIPSVNQETYMAFHHDSPNAEAPHCLLLGALPTNNEIWSKETIKDILLEALDLAKIRSVDYRSLQELRNFLPLLIFNSYGEQLFTRLFARFLPDLLKQPIL